MYNFKDKDRNISELNRYMLVKTLSMFKYDGLPDSLPSIEIEKQLQQQGYTFIAEIDDEYFAFQGGFGGEVDAYNNPTEIIVSNPSLKLNKTFKLDEGVLIKNDDLMLGLLPIFKHYNYLITENEITMVVNGFNNRVQTLNSAGDDSTRESREKYLQKDIAGELGIIGENRLFEGIRSQTTTNNAGAMITHLVEYQQYLKANLLHEIGLDANFNMKRERLTSGETELNKDALQPLIMNMYYNRLKAVERLNDLFGLEVEVSFGSAWEQYNPDFVSEVETITEAELIAGVAGDDVEVDDVELIEDVEVAEVIAEIVEEVLDDEI